MQALIHHLSGLVAQYGVAALFASVTLEALGAPLPGESAVIAASAAAAAGDLDVRAVVAAAFLGAILGDNIGYLIGRKLGRPVIVRYCGRFGATEANMARVEAIAHRYGPLMVVFARFFVILRQLNGIVAGSTGMRWPVFLAANTLGAALWVGLWSTLAYRFGVKIDGLPVIWHHLKLIAAIGVPLLILVLVALHLRNRRRTG